ncbi:MAG: cell division ATP-binding protein FtsE [Coriobacteriales bacterium]|nr:cell division ATP-binding protein FtsE [Coriobacteriales bacterium]
MAEENQISENPIGTHSAYLDSPVVPPASSLLAGIPEVAPSAKAASSQMVDELLTNRMAHEQNQTAAPDEATFVQSVAGQAALDQAASAQAALEVASAQAISGQAISGQAALEVASAQAISGQAALNQAASAQADSPQSDSASSATPSKTISASVSTSAREVLPRTDSAGKPVIVFDRLSKVYAAQPNRPALSNISLSIYAGEFIFLVGHSGSGKSTFIRLINRELVATSGTLIVAGEDLVKMRNWRVPYLRRNIGCVFQDFKLLPNKTAFQNVAFALEVIGKSRHIIRTQVPEVLRLVGLEEKLDAFPDQLSGGEQQRVSIARAIVNRPPLLICDEPTGNLDPQTSLGIMRLLDRINRTGTTILVATHDREMVDSLRKRVVALEGGYLVRDVEKGVYGLDA